MTTTETVKLAVKPLEWGKTSYGKPEAYSIVGVYRINEAMNGGWSVVFGGLSGRALEGHDGRANFATIEAAKAAAQADYESRILSAIVQPVAPNPAPSGEAVPVAPSPVAFVTPETMKDILAQSLWTQGAVGEFRCDNRHGFTVPLYAEPLPSAALSPTGGTTDPAFLPGPSAVQRSRPSGNTPDLVARLRDGIVVQQAGTSTLIGTPDFTATVSLMREAADRLESLSRERDEALLCQQEIAAGSSQSAAVARIIIAKGDAEAALTAVERDLAEARRIIAACAAALGNGAFIDAAASLKFMAGLPDEITAVRAASQAEVARLTEALKQARRTMRNCAGAIQSGQIVDKEVDRNLRRGYEAIDAVLNGRAALTEQKP